MSRFALIIGSPGNPTDEIYEGVESDFANIIAFLKSPSGGGWNRKTEILPLRNPSKRKILDIIKKLNFDYILIYFSGHGKHSFPDNQSYLFLNENEEIGINELISRSSRHLIISDACRTIMPDDFSNWQPERIKFPSTLSIAESRSIFDRHLEECDFGTVHIHSCDKKGEALAVNEGGYHTLSLLHSSQNWTQEINQFNLLPIDVAFNYSVNYLQEFYPTDQEPKIYGKKNLRFPFAVKTNRKSHQKWR